MDRDDPHDRRRDLGIAAETVVYVPSARRRGTRRTFHLSPDCARLDHATSILAKRRGVLAAHLSCCQTCAGTVPAASTQNWSHYNALDEADPEADLG